MIMMKQAAFLALYTEHTIYDKYPEIPESFAQLKVPMVLMVQRWDGTIGFPGGVVSDGKNIREAVMKEVFDEIGIDLNEFRNKAEFICSNKVTGQLETHLFALKINFNEYRNIFENFAKSENLFTKVTGVISPHLRNYPDHRVFTQFLSSNFAPGIKPQLIELRRFLDLEWHYPTEDKKDTKEGKEKNKD